MEGEEETNCYWYTRNNTQSFGKVTWRHKNKRKRGDYPDYGIINIGQNTEKCPEDLLHKLSRITIK